MVLDEVSVSENSPWQWIERGGSFYRYNMFSGQYGQIVGERGLKNVDHHLFNILLLGRKSLQNSLFVSVSSSAFSKDAIAKGVDYVMSNPSKVKHIFGNARHNFLPLVTQMGGNGKVIESTIRLLVSSGKLPVSGGFQISIKMAGYNVTVRGIVQDGIPKIGTMFIP